MYWKQPAPPSSGNRKFWQSISGQKQFTWEYSADHVSITLHVVTMDRVMDTSHFVKFHNFAPLTIWLEAIYKQATDPLACFPDDFLHYVVTTRHMEKRHCAFLKKQRNLIRSYLLVPGRECPWPRWYKVTSVSYVNICDEIKTEISGPLSFRKTVT